VTERDNGKAEPKSDSLVVPKHGRGRIKQGGTHARPGRPPNELRGSMREILEKGLPHLEEFVTGERSVTVECPECGETVDVKETQPADQLKAIDIAAKFGLPKQPYDQDLIDGLWDATEAALLDDLAVVQRVKRAWMPVLARRLMAGG
jgi:hypothetical protein